MTSRDEIETAIDAAFRQVYGIEGERSLAQQVVIARHRQLAKDGKPLFSPIETDRMLVFREGRAEIWLEIKRRTTLDPPSTLADLLGQVTDTNGEDENDN